MVLAFCSLDASPSHSVGLFARMVGLAGDYLAKRREKVVALISRSCRLASDARLFLLRIVIQSDALSHENAA